ncbi:MAG: DUF3800 domain-containing protein [Candidatus Thermoplasmatota archaeon]
MTPPESLLNARKVAMPLDLDELAALPSGGITRYPTHVAYADESHHNQGAYHSIALVTFSAKHEAQLEAELGSILASSGISEFKWARLGGARERFAALNFLDFGMRNAKSGRLRIDVLLWDTTDRRHHIRRRDDTLNLEIMYYNLFRNVFTKRWPDASLWQLRPDENLSLQWQRLHFLLESGDGSARRGQKRLVVHAARGQSFEINTITEAKSHEAPFVQLADLFAGLTVFSRANFARLEAYKLGLAKHKQLRLVGNFEHAPLTRSEKERFNVLTTFRRAMKKAEIRVQFESAKGLRGFPTEPINFWWYESRSVHDRAPTKASLLPSA